ncbi:MAG TPA: dihydrofolate reductase family protein [Puia sp.]|nr:dihydrofolate reductase family protein [Puia sp.]
MGKIVCLINVTADGFCDSHYVIADAEFHEFVHGLLAAAETVGFGRGAFELFQGVWPPLLEHPGKPEPQVRMAQALHNKEKMAFSTTLKAVSWANSRIVREVDAELLARYKEGAKGLLTIGSPGLVASLTAMGVVDEYYFSVQPVIAGGGNVRLFDKLRLETRQPLQFVGATQLGTGVNILRYTTGRA